MYYSLTFSDDRGSVNTYDDWYMAPTSRPSFSPPDFEMQVVSIPGRNGVLDVTNALNKFSTFGNRSGSWEFLIHPESPLSWYETYSRVANYLHGQSKKVSLEDDSEYWYEGRFWLDNFKTGDHYSTITINYNVEPFKKSKWKTTDDWSKNPFKIPDDFNMTKWFKDLDCTAPDSVTGNLWEWDEPYNQVFNSWNLDPLYRKQLIGYGVFTPTLIVNSESGKGLDIWAENDELQLANRVHLDDGSHTNPNILFSAYNPDNGVRIAVKGIGKLSVEYSIRSL